MEVLAGGLSQPGVVHLGEAVVIEVLRSLACQEADDGLGEGVVDGEGAGGDKFGGDAKVLAVCRALPLGNLSHLGQVASHAGSDTRGEAVSQAGAEEVVPEPLALLGGGVLEIVLVKEAAEGD